MTWPKEHIIADEWREAVLVCRCGWRGAERTKTAVRRSWLQHIAISTHACRKCGQTYTPVEGHVCP